MAIYDARVNYGRYLDEFCVGDVFKHWSGKTITEMDNHLFSLITMNHHPMHIDQNFAQSEHKYKKILVVGTLVLSLVTGMTVRDTSGKAIANLQYESIVHDAPVFIGDTIYGESKVLSVETSRKKPTQGVVSIETKAYNQDSVTVLTMKRKFLVPKKTVSNKSDDKELYGTS